MHTFNVGNLSRRVTGYCVRVFLMGLCLFPVFLQPGLWASSPHIQIHSEPPFFAPNQLTIAFGTPLQWNNRTPEPHSIVSDDCRSRANCSFESGLLSPNEVFALPRLSPGRYPYHCGIHPFMRGHLTIHPPRSFSSDI